MSMSGQRLLELEQERKEQLRLAQVRAECTALLDACQATLSGVRDVAVQQYAAVELREVAATLSSAREGLKEQPDATLPTLVQVQESLHQALAGAEAKAKAWTTQQARAVGATRAAAQRVVALTTLGDVGEKTRTTSEQIQAAIKSAEAGDVATSTRILAEADAQMNAVRSKVLEEQVRREVVKGLLKTLRELGFMVVGPALESGVVVLEGRLASGRKARFEVSLEGKMNFDLDGYEGRACAEEMEKVEVVLRDRFGVRLGPPQVVWKNPDRLSQGALNLPADQSKKR